ncbi:MAG: transposase [Gammaproteobacteria bacterium]|nr:transposase [Gammaproteobacteria bacterium]
MVPGGALSGDEWRPAKGHDLFPVRALSHHFRGAMVSAIRKAYQQNKLHRITDPQQVDEKLDGLMKKAWVVYTRPYLTQADTVVKYLSQYSHKIAISNHRMLKNSAILLIDFGQKSLRHDTTYLMIMRIRCFI